MFGIFGLYFVHSWERLKSKSILRCSQRDCNSTVLSFKRFILWRLFSPSLFPLSNTGSQVACLATFTSTEIYKKIIKKNKIKFQV